MPHRNSGLRLALCMILTIWAAGLVFAGVTTRMSVSTAGVQGNGWTHYGDVTANGSVVFASDATNLVTGDTNDFRDIFIRNPVTGITQRLSVSSADAQANGDSYNPAISNDGRYVVFGSTATNLVLSDTNGKSDLFLHDRTTGNTTRISVATDGTQGDDNSSPANLGSPRISPDGRYIAYLSLATNLVTGDTNGKVDAFMRDRVAGTTARASISATGAQPNSLMNECSVCNTSWVAFDTAANNLSAEDTNGTWDVYVKFWPLNLLLRSYSATLIPGNGPSIAPSLSAEGTMLAFSSTSTNFVANDTNGTHDVFLRDLSGPATISRASSTPEGVAANGSSSYPDLSGTGQYVAYSSNATNLVADDTNGQSDIFGWTLGAATVQRLSVSSRGAQGNWGSYNPRVSANGRYVCFVSDSNSLVADDTNGNADIFLRDRWAPSITSRKPTGQTVGPTTKIRITFDPAMNRPTAVGAFRLNPSVAGTFAWSGTTLIFTPDASLAWGQEYTVSVTKAAKSNKGIALANVYRWSFRTAPHPAPGAISGLAASATRGNGADIAVTLTRAASVRATVRNLAGRVVAILPERVCEAGTTRLLWSGKTLTGVSAPAGQWLVEVEANSPDGTSCRRLTTFTR